MLLLLLLSASGLICCLLIQLLTKHNSLAVTNAQKPILLTSPGLVQVPSVTHAFFNFYYITEQINFFFGCSLGDLSTVHVMRIMLISHAHRYEHCVCYVVCNFAFQPIRLNLQYYYKTRASVLSTPPKSVLTCQVFSLFFEFWSVEDVLFYSVDLPRISQGIWVQG